MFSSLCLFPPKALCHGWHRIPHLKLDQAESAKVEKHPRCERKPDEERDPYAARREVVFVKDLRKRPVLERQTHEEFERNREKQPDEPD